MKRLFCSFYRLHQRSGERVIHFPDFGVRPSVDPSQMDDGITIASEAVQRGLIKKSLSGCYLDRNARNSVKKRPQVETNQALSTCNADSDHASCLTALAPCPRPTR